MLAPACAHPTCNVACLFGVTHQGLEDAFITLTSDGRPSGRGFLRFASAEAMTAAMVSRGRGLWFRGLNPEQTAHTSAGVHPCTSLSPRHRYPTRCNHSHHHPPLDTQTQAKQGSVLDGREVELLPGRPGRIETPQPQPAASASGRRTDPLAGAAAEETRVVLYGACVGSCLGLKGAWVVLDGHGWDGDSSELLQPTQVLLPCLPPCAPTITHALKQACRPRSATGRCWDCAACLGTSTASSAHAVQQQQQQRLAAPATAALAAPRSRPRRWRSRPRRARASLRLCS